MKREKGGRNREIVLRGRLGGPQRNRLASLLNMMYKPSELAAEVGFEVRQVYRVYVPAGCPHERDGSGRLWINGVAFNDWYHEAYNKQDMGNGEAFCLTCRQAVEMVAPVEKQKGRLVYWECECPRCGRHLARIKGQDRS